MKHGHACKCERAAGRKQTLATYQGLVFVTHVTGGPKANGRGSLQELVTGIVFRVMRKERKHAPRGTG